MTIEMLKNVLKPGYAVDGWINGTTDETVELLYISTPSGVQEFSEMSIVDVAIELFAEDGIRTEDKTVLHEMKNRVLHAMKRAQANLLSYMKRELRNEDWFMAGAINQLTGAAKIYGRLCQILG